MLVGETLIFLSCSAFFTWWGGVTPLLGLSWEGFSSSCVKGNVYSFFSSFHFCPFNFIPSSWSPCFPCFLWVCHLQVPGQCQSLSLSLSSCKLLVSNMGCQLKLFCQVEGEGWVLNTINGGGNGGGRMSGWISVLACSLLLDIFIFLGRTK